MILLQNGYQVFRIINVTHIVIGTYMSLRWKRPVNMEQRAGVLAGITVYALSNQAF